ncbi:MULTISPECIES: hypothetical protein [unclassified Bradyrhizobium]|uniref:hypothetical protein n=1 Tax=unclassified Bradyrhizobium TaxID=2631580 RepID=UPI002FF1FAA7
MSKGFEGIAQSIHADDHNPTLHGVVFDILVGASTASALRLSFPMMIFRAIEQRTVQRWGMQR